MVDEKYSDLQSFSGPENNRALFNTTAQQSNKQ
jgi:hypothetical protein